MTEELMLEEMSNMLSSFLFKEKKKDTLTDCLPTTTITETFA